MNVLKKILYLKGYAGKDRQAEAVMNELLRSLHRSASTLANNRQGPPIEEGKLTAAMLVTAMIVFGLTRSKHEEQTTSLTKYLSKLLPQELRENLIGDLREEYPDVESRRGKHRAQIWFYHQLVNAVCQILFERVLTQLKGWVRPFTN